MACTPTIFMSPLQQVKNHWQFIQPEFTHKLSCTGNPEIILKFSTFLQAVLLVNIFLQIFRIGMHSPHFIYTDLFSILPITASGE